MRHIFLCMAALAFVPVLRAQDEPKANKEKSSQEQFEALVGEFNGARQQLLKQYRAAKTDAERQKIKKQREQSQEEFAGRFLQLAQKDPKGENAFDAMSFVTALGSRAQAHKALELITKHHPDNLGPLCQMLGQVGSPSSEATLREMMQSTANAKVRASAGLALAQALKGKSESDEVTPEEGAKFANEAKDLFSKIVEKKEADADALEEAKAQLWELINLGIGKKAPEITGKDADGKEFKLSDYQGKVVVIDFWANW
jgi:hypothetical protein